MTPDDGPPKSLVLTVPTAEDSPHPGGDTCSTMSRRATEPDGAEPPPQLSSPAPHSPAILAGSPALREERDVDVLSRFNLGCLRRHLNQAVRFSKVSQQIRHSPYT